MKIISWNVNGIRAAIKNGFFDWFKKEKPDILCLQEIKVKEEAFPEELKKLKGYNLYINSASKPGYAGTAVLTKIEPISIIAKIGVRKFDCEGRFQLLEFDKFYLFNTYFPHSRHELERLDFKIEFNQIYLKFIKRIKDKPIILTGDFNVAHQSIDLANPKENEKNAGYTIEERKFIDQLNKLGYVDTFRKLNPKKQVYSWWTYRFNARKRNIGWRIDYFFVPEKLMNKVAKAEVNDLVLGSDHCPVKLIVTI